MGGGSSKLEVKDEIDIKSLNKSVTNSVSKVRNTTNVNVINMNEMTLKGISCNGGTLVADQTISGDIAVSVDFSSTDVNQIANNIQEEMDTMIDQKVKETSEMGAGWGDFSDKETDVSTLIKQEYKKIVTIDFLSESINESQANVKNKNSQNWENITVDPCGIEGIQNPQNILILKEACKVDGKPPPCLTATQDIAVDVFVQNIANNITEKVSELTIDMSSVLTSTTDVEKENKGVADVVGTFFEGITGLLNSPFFIIGLFVMILLIGLYINFRSGGGKNAGMAMMMSQGRGRGRGRGF